MKNIIKTFIGLSLVSNLYAFDYKTFDYDGFKKSNSLNQYSEFDDEESYTKKKYGGDIKYRTYEERKLERKTPNTLMGLGVAQRNVTKTETSYVWTNDTVPRETDIIEEQTITNSTETKMSVWLATVLDLKYFNIREDNHRWYIGTELGHAIDLELSYDFFDGRHTDFYGMIGGFMRYDANQNDTEAGGLGVGLKATLGYNFTNSIGIFYTMKINDPLLYDDGRYTYEERDGLTEHSLFLTVRF